MVVHHLSFGASSAPITSTSFLVPGSCVGDREGQHIHPQTTRTVVFFPQPSSLLSLQTSMASSPPVLKCCCRFPVAIKTSRTDRNPGRRYLVCAREVNAHTFVRFSFSWFVALTEAVGNRKAATSLYLTKSRAHSRPRWCTHLRKRRSRC